jgi:outer membrane protein TolC
MKNFLLPIIAFIGLSAKAQRMLTLEEAIATSLQNNYDIRLSRNDSLVAALNFSYANAAFLPRLNGNAGITWNINDQSQKFADGTDRQKKGVKSSNIAAGIALNWTLFDGLRMFATRDKLEEFIRLGELGIKNQVVNTIAIVINNYYDITRQKQQLKAIEEQMSVYEDRVKLAVAKFEIGTGIKPDVLQGKVDLNAQIAARMQQQTLISKLKEQLNQQMNVASNTAYDVTDTIPINMNLSLGDIQNNMESTSPSLLIVKQNMAIAEITLRERRADRWPILSFNSAYNFSRTNNNVVVNPFSPLFNQNKGLNYGFTASVPILNNMNTRRLIRQAQLDIQYQQLTYENQRAKLNMNVINAFKDYEFQKQALDLEESNISLAKENVSIAMERYRLGISLYLELRDAQKSLEDAYNRLISARYNTKLAETELLRLRGDLVR